MENEIVALKCPNCGSNDVIAESETAAVCRRSVQCFSLLRFCSDGPGSRTAVKKTANAVFFY